MIEYLLANVWSRKEWYLLFPIYDNVNRAKVRARQELRGMERRAEVHKPRVFISLPISYQHLSDKCIVFSSCFLYECMNNQATTQLCSLEINVLVKEFSRVCIFLFAQSYKSRWAASVHCTQPFHLPTVHHAPSSQHPSHILLHFRPVPHLDRKEVLGNLFMHF